jgi:Tol biopolymer transport system component
VGPAKTPSPSAPPVIAPDVKVTGSLVYAKEGNLWIQTGTTATQLTKTGRDSQPTWSPDGKWIYFIETRQTRGLFPVISSPNYFDLHYPILTRIGPDGKGRQALLSGLYRSGPGNHWVWQWFIEDPAVAPNNRLVALVSDGPDPTRRNVVLQLYDVKTKKLTATGVPENQPLGHQDPAWRPDGSQLLYVMNGRDGTKGAPVIKRYDLATKKTRSFTGPGYMQPIYSPDGRLVAATKTNSLGTDVVVLDARNGSELVRVTNDGRSWGPAWSPDGTQLVFLTLGGASVDLQLATLDLAKPYDPSVTKVEPLTEFSGLDGNSRPAWYVPPRPTPTPSPTLPTASPATATP